MIIRLQSPVYLAGGLKSGWQDRMIAAFPREKFFNPASHGLTNEREYTGWDLDHVSKARTLFGYMEKDNPSGIGLALEIGFACAQNKFIIFVDETSREDYRKFGMARSAAHVIFQSLDEAMLLLLP